MTRALCSGLSAWVMHAADAAISDPAFHLWVAGANHDELGGVHNAHAFPFHCVDAAGRAVEHHIHQSVVQQIHLIHI